jgi:hypothetical protein
MWPFEFAAIWALIWIGRRKGVMGATVVPARFGYFILLDGHA